MLSFAQENAGQAAPFQKNMEKKDSPLGTSYFKTIIEENRYYVDKTMLVRQIIKGNHITLLCRPRRFGKSLNLDMLRRFFAKGEDNGHLFEGLKISQDATSMGHQGQYPVIMCSFKEAKQDSAAETFKRVRRALSEAWQDHPYLADNEKTAVEYHRTLEQLASPETDLYDVAWSLRLLSKLLHRHHQAPAVILIDEYDTPVHAGWLHGYYKS